MDDFRAQLTTVIDELAAQGIEPVFVLIDLAGAERIRKERGDEAFNHFRTSVISAVSSAGNGCDAFSYGDERVVAILTGVDRLKTFAIVEKLRRSLPFMAQSFDVPIRPEFDIIDYDPAKGVPGLVHELVKRSQRIEHEDREAS